MKISEKQLQGLLAYFLEIITAANYGAVKINDEAKNSMHKLYAEIINQQSNELKELAKIITGNKIYYMTRKDWPFKLYFCPLSQSLIIKSKDDLTPYAVSRLDFYYEWIIVE